jgi:hypothetical protein
MESISALLSKFAHELPATAVGFFGLIILFLLNSPFETELILNVAWGERILVFLILSYVTGKIFSYIGYFVLSIISYFIHIKHMRANFEHFIDSFKVLRPSTKCVSIFPNSLLTTPALFEYIGSNPYLQEEFSARSISMSFCLALLGGTIVTPYLVNTEIYTQTDYRLFLLFITILGMNSLLTKNKFYGECAKEVSKRKREKTA